MEDKMHSIDAGTANEVHVNFPFLDVHPEGKEHFTSNVSLTQSMIRLDFSSATKMARVKDFLPMKKMVAWARLWGLQLL